MPLNCCSLLGLWKAFGIVDSVYIQAIPLYAISLRNWQGNCIHLSSKKKDVDFPTKMLFLYVAAFHTGWIVRKCILLNYPFVAWIGVCGNLPWNCCTAVVHSICFFVVVVYFSTSETLCLWGFIHCIFLWHIPFCSCSFNLCWEPQSL